MTGQTHTKEHNKKIAQARIGRKASEETRELLSKLAIERQNNNPRTLTICQVREIKNLINNKCSDKNISEIYGISQKAINNIRNKKSWTDTNGA